jgi:ribonuclease D
MTAGQPVVISAILLSKEEEIKALAQELRKADIIAFDTEFIRETTFFPVVEIIQVATATQTWLVDARAFIPQSHRAGIQPLLDVFQDQKILKIVHAAQGDQECLCTAFGIVASPSLDTAVAASLCGYGEAIGLGNLLKSALGVTIKKGHARTDWTVRPLPPQLAEYAAADVDHLVALGQRLLEELDGLGRRAWAFELSAKWEDRSLYESNPEEIAKRLSKGGKIDKRSYAALLELVIWREERVRKLNLPRRWVADDNVLVDLAQVRPKDLGHLGAFRGLNKGELKASGQAILDAIHRSSGNTEVNLPKQPRAEIPSSDEAQVLDLLKTYVGILSDRHRIASKHLITTPKILGILRSGAKTAQEFVQADLLSQGSADLIGEEIIALLEGRRALSVKENRVDIVEVGPKV